MNFEQIEERLRKLREFVKEKRKNETPEQRKKRLRKQREYVKEKIKK